jgi:uncharacterized protein (TIGR03000 family)
MFQKLRIYGSTLIFAGVIAIATPEFAWAQHGGHGGGGHMGGGFAGGGHFGGGFGGGHFGGGFGGHYGGLNHGGFHDGHHDGFHHHRHFGNFPYYGGYYYPYGSYYPDYSYYQNYDSGYYDRYADQTPTYSDPNSAVTPPSAANQTSDGAGHVTVGVPPDALVWFDQKATKSTGAVREFETPPMNSGGQYTYQIKATWKQDGREVTQTQKVQLSAGAHVTVTFPLPQDNSGRTAGGAK